MDEVMTCFSLLVHIKYVKYCCSHFVRVMLMKEKNSIQYFIHFLISVGIGAGCSSACSSSITTFPVDFGDNLGAILIP